MGSSWQLSSVTWLRYRLPLWATVGMGNWAQTSVVSSGLVPALGTIVALQALGLVVCAVFLVYTEERVGEHAQGRCYEATQGHGFREQLWPKCGGLMLYSDRDLSQTP